MLYMSDEDILTLYIDRNEDAIVETYRKYNRDIKKIINSIICNAEDTEECMNDTYFALWNNLHSIRAVCLKKYILEVAKNTAYSVLRKKLAKKRKAILIELFDMDGAERVDIIYDVEYEEVLNCIRTFLQKETEFNRQVFMMHYFRTTPLAIIAAIYGKTSDQIKMVLYRMRQKLKNHLMQEEIHL